MSTTNPVSENKSLTKKEITGCIVVLLILVGVGYQMMHQVPKSSDVPTKVQPVEHSDVDAYIDAQAVVTKTLKAPSTAKFPSSSHATVERAENEGFKVSSYVDSQNGFGAMIRSDWTVVFQYTPDEKLDVWLIVVDGQEVYRKPAQ